MRISFLFFVLLVVASFKSYSQKNNEISVYSGFVYSELLRNSGLDGDAEYDNKSSYEFGFKYLRGLSNKLSLETGVNYFKTNVTITPAPTGEEDSPVKENLKLVSIPIYVNYSFGKYFYINGGPTLDFQSGKRTFDSQSGIGYGIGIGGRYNFNNFLIYVNPNLKRHSLIPFESEKHHQKLTRLGVQVGVAYKF